jgi:hypothetical protein
MRYRPATSSVHCITSCNKQSNALEDGRNHRPKHAELIGIINKLLLLHVVGVYITNKFYLKILPLVVNVEKYGRSRHSYFQNEG